MSESHDSADPSSRPLTVPEALAQRFRAAAARGDEDPQAFLEHDLAMIAHLLEGGGDDRPHRWFLGYLYSDDGPTPPTSFEKVAGDYPRWEARPFRPETPSTDAESAAEGEEDETGTALCVLHRDDCIRAVVEIVPTRGEIVIVARGASGHAERTLLFEPHEGWLDLGTRVWRRVMSTADAVADELVARSPDDGDSGGETPA